ncbi:irregular chiasm C-roughest protein-like isoform X1 [Centruroides vittatus]|uniref:irregular chiasm C-roughest protein-like isoform X1 n=1 Tax=Centruroides vittatus TaxID=120091 RepID=UPI00350F836A
MLTSCLCVAIVAKGVLGLRLSKLEVPGVVVHGEPVWLNCSFDIETDELYSIKWYKNNLEFYRYLPSDHPPAQKYDLLGIYLDLVKSELGRVYLYKTDLNSDGRYRCEVSAEAPSFQTVRAEKEMRIYVLPEHGPTVSEAHSRHRSGEEVNVTCTSALSKPAAILKWYINDKEASRDFQIHYPPLLHVSGLESSRLGLNFVADSKHFWNGTMKLRCVSLMSQVYAKSSVEIVATKNARASGLHSAGVSGEAVTITGGKLRYQIGEHVDVNCTAVKSRPPAELRWFINDKKIKSEIVTRYPTVIYPDGQESSILGLRFMVLPRHYKKGEMRLKCTATLSKVFNSSSKEMILGGNQQSSGLHVLDNGGKVLNRGPPLAKILWILMVGVLIACL